MPIVRVELSKGRTHEQKRTYVEAVTQLTSQMLNCPAESIDVVFIEIEPSNWAHAGKFYGEPSK
jgi:4-oxalocrotonate tautomerase